MEFKKEQELEAWKIVYEKMPKFQSYELLSSNESPDFIFEDADGNIIGLEHFLLDTYSNKVIRNNKTTYHSHTRQNNRIRKQLAEEGLDYFKSVENDETNKSTEKELKLTQDIENMVNFYIQSSNFFSYENIIDSLQLTLSKHNKNVINYKNNIKKIYGKVDKIGCLIEYPILFNTPLEIEALNGNKYVYENNTDLFITPSMESILKNRGNNFDFFIFVTYINAPYNIGTNKGHKQVFYFKTKQDIKANCKSFKMKHRPINVYTYTKLTLD